SGLRAEIGPRASNLALDCWVEDHFVESLIVRLELWPILRLRTESKRLAYRRLVRHEDRLKHGIHEDDFNRFVRTLPWHQNVVRRVAPEQLSSTGPESFWQQRARRQVVEDEGNLRSHLARSVPLLLPEQLVRWEPVECDNHTIQAFVGN